MGRVFWDILYASGVKLESTLHYRLSIPELGVQQLSTLCNDDMRTISLSLHRLIYEQNADSLPLFSHK